MEIYKRERKVNRPNSDDPISFSLDSSRALFLELFGGDGHRTDRQNRDRVKVKAAEYLAK